MKAEFFILQICDFLDDGDGFYRLHEPSRQLSRLPGVVVVDCHFYHRLLPALIEGADVIVLPFIHDWDLFPMIEQRRAAGKVTVFEANDYFYDIQPWNPIGAQWQDRSIQGEYRQYMAAADAVQTSTNELARRWREWSRRVAVFKNYLTELPPLTPPPSRPLTIGWGGSPGHFADWYHIAPVLEKWLRAHPDVHLAVMNNEFAQPFIQLPPDRYHFTPFGSLSSYLKFLPSLDIGLAPLLPSEYNRCRSDVKFLEYASHGIPGIYTDLEPYRETVVHGKTGLLYKTEEELLQQLDALASDAALRQRIREEAYQYVAKNRRIEQHIGERVEFYRKLLPTPPQGFEIPEDVVGEAVRDGNYLQLRPQEPEQMLLEAIKTPTTREAAQSLARVVERHPNYLAALQQLGRMLNDLREYRNAIPYLERAAALNPKSARTLCEIGRARFVMGDAEGGRRDLQAALEVNPLFYPGWQYMLRMLELRKSPDGRSWAERAFQLHPYSYMLGLAGAKLFPGVEAVKETHRLLDQFAPLFTPEERPSAAATFSQTIMEVIGPFLSSADALALLGRGCEVFPKSARLADLLGRALRLAGRHEESNEQLARALEIRRVATAYQTEFPKEDGTFHYWQFAENIRKWARKK